MSLTSLFENEANALKIGNDQLSGISALARRAKQIEKEIADQEDTLKELKLQCLHQRSPTR